MALGRQTRGDWPQRLLSWGLVGPGARSGPTSPLTSQTRERKPGVHRARGKQSCCFLLAVCYLGGLPDRFSSVRFFFFNEKLSWQLSECHVQGTESYQRRPRSPSCQRSAVSHLCPRGPGKAAPQAGAPWAPVTAPLPCWVRVSTTGRLGHAKATQPGSGPSLGHSPCPGPPPLADSLGAWRRVGVAGPEGVAAEGGVPMCGPGRPGAGAFSPLLSCISRPSVRGGQG